MQSTSNRVLRERKQPINYFPKQLLYSVVLPGSRRRSRSLEQRQPQTAARRINRSQSVDQTRMAARRASRSRSIESRARQNDTVPDTLGMLAQANALLTTELIKMKDELDAKNKKIDALVKQDTANQRLIGNMVQDSDQKQKQLACLQNQLDEALHRVGKTHRVFIYWAGVIKRGEIMDLYL